MGVGNYGQLLHLYYGKRLTGDMRYLLIYYDRGFSGNPYEAECDKTYSMDALPQEYPGFGNGDFRSPAFILKMRMEVTVPICGLYPAKFVRENIGYRVFRQLMTRRGRRVRL